MSNPQLDKNLPIEANLPVPDGISPISPAAQAAAPADRADAPADQAGAPADHVATIGVPAAAATADAVAAALGDVFGPIQAFVEGIALLVRRTFFN